MKKINFKKSGAFILVLVIFINLSACGSSKNNPVSVKPNNLPTVEGKIFDITKLDLGDKVVKSGGGFGSMGTILGVIGVGGLAAIALGGKKGGSTDNSSQTTTSTTTATISGTITLPANTNAKLFAEKPSFFANLFTTIVYAGTITDLTTLKITAGGITTNADSKGKYTLTINAGTNIEIVVTTPSNNIVLEAIIPSLTAGSTITQDINTTTTSIALIHKQNTSLSLSQIQSSSEVTNVKNTIETALADSTTDSITSNTAVNTAVNTAITAISQSALTLTSISISSTVTSIAVGETLQFSATATYSDNSTADITYSATWSSSNTSIGTINSNGLFTAVASGTTNISAVKDGVTSSTKTITVTAVPVTLDTISVSCVSTSLTVSQTTQCSATGNYSDNSTKDITSSVTWSSSNTSVGTINSSGLFTASTVGTANISAVKDNIASGTISITVSATQTVTLNSITISTTSSSVTIGNTLQFSATGNYSDNSTNNLTTTATWSSSNTNVATINSSGKLTAVSSGTTTISATSNNVISNSQTITVKQNQAPTAIASSNITCSVFGPSEIKFTGGGTDADGTIVSYNWNFGDNTTSTSQSLSHIYYNSGTYTVILTVTDDKGATASDSLIITIYPGYYPADSCTAKYKDIDSSLYTLLPLKFYYLAFTDIEKNKLLKELWF